ncbi:FecR domain-containing protein [Candidatus Woesearchaeota archaeon]|nr:FecR domain-containing protein [Candidatus Woesearchaeota archaeon]
MNKIIYIIGGIVLILAVIFGIGYYKITTSPTKVAILHIEQGQVQVDKGKGWTNAIDEMNLAEDYKIKTLGDGMASVILYESIIISLEPNTEVNIADLSKEHIKLDQQEGTTWNKFTALAGVKGLSIETPTTVATVRGTSFEVTIDSVTVGEGTVEVEYDGEKIKVEKDEKVEIKEETKEGKKQLKAVKKALAQEEKQKIANKMQRTVRVMKKIREMEVKKNEFLARQLQKQYDISEEEVKEYLEKADRGEFDLEEVEKKAPVKIEAVRKIKEMTQEIIKQNREIEQIQPELVRQERIIKTQQELLQKETETQQQTKRVEEVQAHEDKTDMTKTGQETVEPSEKTRETNTATLT